MKLHPDAGLDVGQQRALVQQQHQTRPLAEVSRRRTTADKVVGLSQELGGEAGTVQRCGAGHGDGPLAATLGLSMNYSHRSEPCPCGNPTGICGTNH
jgi:hypothetical protein